MLAKFDLKTNFWEVYPQYKIGFKKLYEGDKSSRKKESSKIMWAIALLMHPSSEYAVMTTDERKALIEKDWLETTYAFKWEKYEEELELFKKLCMTKKERFLIAWEKKLEERDEFLERYPYNEDTAEFVDKIMLNADKLQLKYDKVVEEYYKEKTATSGQGGAEESLRERLKA